MIGLPRVHKREQRRPTLERESIIALINSSTEWERLLYILCAGTGLRIAESLAIDIDQHIRDGCSTILVRQQVKGAEIVPYLKTRAAFREVDICAPLAELLRDYTSGRHGLLFPSDKGTARSYLSLWKEAFHPKFVSLGIYEAGAGMRMFRRFRAAQLDRWGCPEDLRKHWRGHENQDMSAHYAEQLLRDTARRKEWAEKIGLGFELPQSLQFSLQAPIFEAKPLILQ